MKLTTDVDAGSDEDVLIVAWLPLHVTSSVSLDPLDPFLR